MPEPNFPNRTLAIMDNIKFLKVTNSESIDLIAIDPPFAANETFEGKPKPPITLRELGEEKALADSHGVEHNEGIGETRVDDHWFWDKLRHEPWLKKVRVDNEEIGALIDAVEMCATENEAAYIAFMAARLLECHRVLKETGSIYVHCDDRANAYLRMLMNAIFGSSNFRNEIVWKRNTSNNAVLRGYGRITDYILFYTKSDKFTWNQVYHQRTDAEMREYRKDKEGRLYKCHPLTGPGYHRQFTWRGATPSSSESWRYDEDELEAMLARGEIELGKNGKAKLRGRIRYLDDMPEGAKCQTIWTDIPKVGNKGSERVGYATQKPLKLYRRLICASSNPGDVVLDLFAGCATTAIAAEKEGRQWLACDMAYRSWTMLKRRFYQNDIILKGTSEATFEALAQVHPFQGRFAHKPATIIGPDELPARDYVEHDEIYDIPNLELRRRRTLQPWQKMKDKEMRAILEEAQALSDDPRAIVCPACGRAPEPEFMQLDHLTPKKDGGEDFLNNRILMCGPCNRRKKDRLTYSGIVKENKAIGWTVDRKRADAAKRRRDDAVEMAIHEMGGD